LEPSSLLRVDRKLEPGKVLADRGALGRVVSTGIPPDLMTSPANRLYVDSSLVGQAVKHLKALTSKGLARVLDSHGFGRSAGLLLDQREKLIAERRDALIDGEREFLTEKGVSLPVDRIGETVRDSDANG